MTTPIPRPPSLPIIGNLTSIDGELGPTDLGYMMLTNLQPMYLPTRSKDEKCVCIGSVALAQEVLDEKRFHKVIDDVLKDIRKIGGDGLFTAYHDEPTWAIAHRILMPAFGPLSIKNMFDDMVDVVSQLVLKWERFGPRHEIDPAEDFSKLAFDTIALCTFNYRLNSFYTEGDPPFVKAMMDFLIECNMRTRRPAFVRSLPLKINAKFKADMEAMNKLASQIIQERKQNPIEKKDLLNAMLNGRDPQTGEGLSDENIQYQMLTFLIAGHETTSGMLSFVMMHVLRHPNVYAKIKQEVDTVLGKDKIKFEHLGQLTYITAVLRESLRLTPSIGEFIVTCSEDQVIGNGKYLIKKDTTVVEEFKPERMLDGRFEALPVGIQLCFSDFKDLSLVQPKAWIPFGSGSRGRPFSWQEALTALATLFQKFDFVPVDPAYKLQIKQTITLKPQGFKFRAIPRKGTPSFSDITQSQISASVPAPPTVVNGGVEKGIPLYVLYGSNSGSCEGFAQTIASKAAGKASNIPTDGPVVIVTASFEGEPADNAGHFVEALTTLDDVKDLDNVSFAVFGAGNHEWAQTYQRIPRLVDAILEKKGAKRLLELGEGDASGSSFLESFNEWEENLWSALAKEYNIEAQGGSNVPKLEIEFVGGPTNRAAILRQPDSRLGLVIQNKIMTAPGAPVKHHIEFELPSGMNYQTGDYLAIASGPTTLPTGKPVGISEVLSGFVEIGQVVTKRNISTLLEYATEPATRVDLETMLQNYNIKEGNPQVTMLNLLEKYRDIDMPLGTFIASLPTMRLRQYSISSSPLWSPSRVTLTFGVIGNGQFFGVGSNYLANLRKGDKVQMLVRPSAKAFHPPSDPKVPMVLFAAGSGMAPFRGFLQERAMQAQAGRQVGKSVLFFGCRMPNEDYLYADNELAEWSKLGVVEVRPTFSRAPERSEGNKYVQHRIWADRALVREYFDNGAKFYTCGGSHIAAGIRETFIRIVGEYFGEQRPEEVFKKIQSERYATDVFG
ncbi:fatty acid hydroxylase, putative [Rhizoctonia solani AG-1 IA]|uniref:Fatty acid hydroxylase, putative n=1 Tax=Thanatephorus cucumeris (strain AG1-IA) TaxID=983506 RepID=L8WZU4_THACA|nr:fatty acid hydroxylase, putative [Rhizoctonia solani AG-1 IA]